MNTTDHLLTHDQFRHLLAICLHNMGIPDQFHDDVVDGLYPAKPIDALAELHARGYDATLRDVCDYCCDRANGVLRKHGSYWLTPGDIDCIAVDLLVADRLSRLARERLASGTTAESKLSETAGELMRTLDQRRVATCRN